MELDHLIPVTWFLQETPANIVNSLDNLQLITKEENIKKRNFYASPVKREFYNIAIGWVNSQYKDFITHNG